jgi:hypothetical protein
VSVGPFLRSRWQSTTRTWTGWPNRAGFILAVSGLTASSWAARRKRACPLSLKDAGAQDKLQPRPSPPGQPKVLVVFKGFSELFGFQAGVCRGIGRRILRATIGGGAACQCLPGRGLVLVGDNLLVNLLCHGVALQALAETSFGVVRLKTIGTSRVEFTEVDTVLNLARMVRLALKGRDHLLQTFNLALLIGEGLLHQAMHLYHMNVVLLGAFLLKLSDLLLVDLRYGRVEEDNRTYGDTHRVQVAVYQENKYLSTGVNDQWDQ